MKLIVSCVVGLLVAAGAGADDWSGKTITVKEPVKLGRKLGNGLVRDGAALEPGKPYMVKSDDGTNLELPGGHIFKFEATLAADEKPFPKVRAKDTDPAAAKGEWFGKKVLPKRDQSTIRMGDDEDGKPVYWTPHNLWNCTVREDRDGYLRLYDDRREGWVLKDDMVTAADAPAWWDKAVKEKPNNVYAWWMRGLSWHDKGEYDNAIKDLNEAIRLKPDSTTAYTIRGMAWYMKGECDKAIADYDEAIRLDPKFVTAHNNRGCMWYLKKEYDKAIADCDTVLKLDPKNSSAFNALCWMWATCPQDSIRNGKKAVEYGNKAVELNASLWFHHGSLAAAYAEAGDFEQAIVEQTKAIELLKRSSPARGAAAALVRSAEQPKPTETLTAVKASDQDDLKKAEARLELYRAKKPYRDEE